MSDDRRGSLRRQSPLPLTWCQAPGPLSPAELCQTLKVPRALTLHARLSELDEAFRQARAQLTDARLTAPLEALNERVTALEEALFADVAVPPAVPVELSVDGAGFFSTEPLPPDTWLAVHLVLPVGRHLICSARVTHCSAGGEGDAPYRIGCELQGLSASDGRRLTRYVIARERREDG